MLDLAIIKSVVGNAVHVTIPRRTGTKRTYGPCRIIEGIWTETAYTDETELGVAGSHTHTEWEPWAGDHTHGPNPHEHRIPAQGKELKVGDTVLVGYLAGDVDRPVIVGRLMK